MSHRTAPSLSLSHRRDRRDRGIFKHAIDFTCLENWPPAACDAASGVLVSIYCVMGALALFIVLVPAPFRRVVTDAGQRSWPLAVNFAGLCLAPIPISFMQDGEGTAALLPAYLFWCTGMALLVGGLLSYLAPVWRWRSFLAENWTQLTAGVLAGAMAPSLAILIRPLWNVEYMAGATFHGVTWALSALGYAPDIHLGRKIIGSDDFNIFYIDIAPVCSGIEGMALVTLS